MRCSLFVVLIFGVMPEMSRAQLTLTAEIYDSPGLPGYQTFDIWAMASTAELVGWDVADTDSGIWTGVPRQSLGFFGPMSRDGRYGNSGSPTDSGFLGDWGLQNPGWFNYRDRVPSGQAAPVIRLVTDEPGAVNFSGIARLHHDPYAMDPQEALRHREYAVDFTLEEFLSTDSLEFGPVESPQPISPKPTGAPFDTLPPVHQTGDTNGEVLIFWADVYDTPGLPGYQTWDVTAMAADDGIFGFYVDEFVVDEAPDGHFGITGPMHQKSLFEGGGVFSRIPDDSGFLSRSDTSLVLLMDESSDSLLAIYTIEKGIEPPSSLPFVRIVTDDASSVRLDGAVFTKNSVGFFPPRFDFKLSELQPGPITVLQSLEDVLPPPSPEPGSAALLTLSISIVVARRSGMTLR